MFTQMSGKDGIKKFGDEEVTDMVREYIQIDKGTMEGKPVVTTIDPYTLSFEKKRKVIEAVNIIK